MKFNIKGQHSGGIVFAEASNKMDMKKGEWVYLVVQVGRRRMRAHARLCVLC